MLPNSRIVPPPSSPLQSTDRDPHRKRSLSAAAPPAYLSSPSPKPPNSKNFLSRIIVNNPPNQPVRPLPHAASYYGHQPTTTYTAVTLPRAFYSAHSSLGDARAYQQQQEGGRRDTVPEQKAWRKPLMPEETLSSPRNQTIMETVTVTTAATAEHAHSRGRHLSMYEASKTPAVMETATSDDAAQRKASQKGAIKGGFGRFFRKLSRASDEEMLDDLPKVRPIPVSGNGHIASRTPHNIPLAPAPPPPPSSSSLSKNRNIYSNDRPPIEIGMPDIPSDLIARPRTAQIVVDSKPIPEGKKEANRPRKSSTGHSSIYTTFGPESYHSASESTLDVPLSQNLESSDDHAFLQTDSSESSAMMTVDSLDHNREHEDRRLDYDNAMGSVKEEDHQTDTTEDDEDDDDDDDDEVFVDATGSSQDDIEREKGEAKLSKRLSGGHFGSAGGLMLVTAASEVSNMPSLPASARRESKQTPPEDIAQAMLNWKRQSGGTNNKRQSSMTLARFVADSEKLVAQLMEKENELALPEEKQVHRQQAEEALVGGNSKPATAQQPQQQQHDERKQSSKDITDALSKTLDDAWKSPAADIAKLLDPRDTGQQPGAKEEHSEEEAKEAAERLWNEDESFVSREHIAEWLGQGKPLNANALVFYMNKFEFSNMRLDSAFRKLCSKLYFKAEAQQIDRILEVFANRYWNCNPDSILKSPDVVYAVVYSVLLLNTDLHVAQGNYSRMTRQEFIRNTMTAVHDQRSVSLEIEKGSTVFSRAWEVEVEAYLKELYTSVKQYQILQPLSRKPSHHDASEKRGSLLGSRRVVGLKRSVGSIIRRSGRESMVMTEEIQPRTSTSSGPRPSSPSPRSPRRESFSSVGSSTSFGSRPRVTSLSPTFQPMMQFMDAHGTSLFVNQPPYVKEGVVMRKHLLETANQKAKHREWRECLLVVEEGELKMYALQGSSSDFERRSMLRASSTSFASLADSLSKVNHAAGPALFDGGVTSPTSNNKWASQSQLLGTIPLNHTLSNVLPPPGYNRQRPHVFALQQPDGGVYLFQAASQDQVNEWVGTCNYWAARQSKEPLPGGVSNMEYGWGACLDDIPDDLDSNNSFQQHYYSATASSTYEADALTIYEWRPPAPPLVSSTLDEREQYDALQKHLAALDEEINKHRELKEKMLIKFPSKSQNHVRAMSNWESKSKYLLHEIIKYQNYCDALEKSIRLHEEEEEEQVKRQTGIRLDYHASTVDLVKEIGDELQLAF